MENIAIIAEYNPLHNGHLYQISELHNSDNIIVALSGNFTERGDVAVANKYERAKWAVQNGASMVVEIPTFGVLSCAEHYAKCAISTLKKLGIVNKLCFGSEAGDIDILSKIKDISISNNTSVSIKEYLNQGMSYPAALSNVISAEANIPNVEEILSKPNNILGIEYLKALDGTNIEPLTIKRIGNDYNNNTLGDEKYASATSIRENLNTDGVTKYLPSDILDKIRNTTINHDALLHMLFDKLIMNNADITKINNISEGIDNRIREAILTSNSYEQLVDNIKTKRYTMARIKRTLLDIILNINSNMSSYIDSIDYVTVLAIRRDKLELLRNINGNIVTRYNDYNKTTHPFSNIDKRANALYNHISTDKITSHQMLILD